MIVKKQPVKVWKVNFIKNNVELETKRYTLTKSELWNMLKNWSEYVRKKDSHSSYRFVFEEVLPKPKPLTSVFLSSEKQQAIRGLQLAFKEQQKFYRDSGEDFKLERLNCLYEQMWNSFMNEFFMSADICDNSIWHYQDRIREFDEFGYLDEIYEVPLTEWSQLLKGWYNVLWAREILKLIQTFNLDNQDSDIVAAFQTDFAKVKNEGDFSAALFKWFDLINYHPEKLELLKYTVHQPLSSHYDDDFNDEFDLGVFEC